MKTHRLTSLAVLCVFLVMAILRADAVSQPNKPNIIFILADDMGYSDMSWQGSPIRTPHLDMLREGGMFLGRHYAQPQCTPSRVALLTGRYPYRYGLHEHVILPWSLTGLPGEAKTMAEKLKEAGYETAHIGKWHVGGHLQSYLPHHQGFDYSFSCINGEIYYWNYTHYGLSDIIENGKKYYAPSPKDNESAGNTYATHLWTQKATEVIRNHDTSHPLFMYLAYTAPHHPLQAPRKTIEKYTASQIDAFWDGPDAEKGRTAKSRRLYMAMVDELDAAVGEVVQTLKEKEMLDNTLIVFSIDNGGIPEADNRPLRSIKGDSFEGGVRVPAIAYWPGRIRPGSTNSALVYIADWYPTFAELAGLSVTEDKLDGVSAEGVLRGQKGLRQEVPIISEGRHALITEKYALVGGGPDYQHLLHQNFPGYQLYDLDADVAQKKPDNKHPEIAQQMRQSLADHFRKVNRGEFNWDVTYNNDRLAQRQGDHNYDSVVNDLPSLTVTETAGQITVTISPVSKELAYQLQGSADGKTWLDIAEYNCRKDGAHFAFPPFKTDPAHTQYRVQTRMHLGLPMREAFAALRPGSAFLSRTDITGKVDIATDSLAYGNWPREGGALQLYLNSSTTESSMTRYCIEPYARGNVYATMLVDLQDAASGEVGEIIWLQQNGVKETKAAASVSLRANGIFLESDCAAPTQTITRVAGNDGGVVCLAFEFNLGPTGQDTLNIYLNPTSGKPFEPVARLRGEFTFDRLLFKLSGQGDDSKMSVDELRIGRSWEDVGIN